MNRNGYINKNELWMVLLGIYFVGLSSNLGCSKASHSQIWQENSVGLLMESVGGDLIYPKQNRSSFFSIEDLSSEQISVLESWRINTDDNELKCAPAIDGFGDEVTIYYADSTPPEKYYSTNLACGDNIEKQMYISQKLVNNFKREYTYKPGSERGVISIKQVDVDENYLTITYQHSTGCGSYKTANLVINEIDDITHAGYVVYRSDNICEALGTSQLIVAINESKYKDIQSLKLEGWEQVINLR